MCWGGAVFMSGWILRCIASYQLSNRNLYIAQTVLILAGPPIYSAAEYNILGRLMLYLPMHAPLNPNRVIYFFIYLGIAVENLTASGASRQAGAKGNQHQLKTGQTLVAIAIVLQGAIELVFMAMVGLLHYRCARSNMLSRNVRNMCIMLYGTSTLVLLRCVFRAVESFSILNLISTENCNGTCNNILRHEWYLYAFEAAPMVIYTYWLNIMHPGRLLPQQPNRFLDSNQVVRVGPGWIDKRPKWMTFVDPLDLGGILRGQSAHEKFWLRPDDWPVAVDDGSVQETGMDDMRDVKEPNHTDVPIVSEKED